ncbi:MAG: hypothetical protein IJP89_05185 [Synergistaceae bacterium]|nr:hypothetical protein [Synergistaceae bacterium]MBR0257055.1 hypothetical protein [Synergistaceae bacterium]
MARKILESVHLRNLTTKNRLIRSTMFIEATKRAKQAGYDGVQIHAAHFFFLSRFISPRVNRRNDTYGGNTLRRSRILTEILAGIKSTCPRLHVSVKTNSSDFTTKIELLSLSRPLLRESDLPAKFLNDTSSESKCISCNTCYGSHAHMCVFVEFR